MPMFRTPYRRLLLVVLLASMMACTPMHAVKPLPNFVDVALTPGDRVTVQTHDGATHEFIITEIRGDTLVGDNQQFALRDLASIQKHAWKRPESPCGGEEPLGCSIPLLVSLASERHNQYRKPFYDACAQHDYCYRHGAATYGVDRQSCDDEFLTDMQNSCPNAAGSKVGKVIEVLDNSVQSRRACLSVANDFYSAVRRYGEDRFETANSSYCEYNGPPQKPVGAGQPANPPPNPQ